MKLIIDIPEEIYKATQIIKPKYDDVIQIPLEVIANGKLFETMNKHEIRTVFINEIAKQYKEHNEPIPHWLNIGHIEFDLDKPITKDIEVQSQGE